MFKRYIDFFFFLKIIQLWNLLDFTCRGANAREHKFKVLRESRTAVRAQMGAASDTWCYGHMVLPNLYVPIREESIIASSRLPMKQEHLYRGI